MWISQLILLLSIFSLGGASLAKVSDDDISPLDNKKTSDVKEPSFWIYGEEYGDELPSCATACSSQVLKVISHFVLSGNVSQSMTDVCSDYSAASICLRAFTQCPLEIYTAASSGLKYMCEEQKEAFQALIGCVDESSITVNKDCEAQCNPKGLVAGMALKDTVLSTLDRPQISSSVNMRQIIEPHMSRLFFSEGCRIAQCMMKCYKTKFNMLCEGTAGSLLAEMLVRPLAQTDLASIKLTTFLRGLMPHQCTFLSKDSIKVLKIDPQLNEEIRRMYTERKRREEERKKEEWAPVSIENPFSLIEEKFTHESPIGGNTVIERGNERALFDEREETTMKSEMDREELQQETSTVKTDMEELEEEQESTDVEENISKQTLESDQLLSTMQEVADGSTVEMEGSSGESGESSGASGEFSGESGDPSGESSGNDSTWLFSGEGSADGSGSGDVEEEEKKRKSKPVLVKRVRLQRSPNTKEFMPIRVKRNTNYQLQFDFGKKEKGILECSLLK